VQGTQTKKGVGSLERGDDPTRREVSGAPKERYYFPFIIVFVCRAHKQKVEKKGSEVPQEKGKELDLFVCKAHKRRVEKGTRTSQRRKGNTAAKFKGTSLVYFVRVQGTQQAEKKETRTSQGDERRGEV
jgi:hypothetical protein